MTEEFDPYKHAASVLDEIPQQSARKLTFAERCAAFAAFKIGYRPPVIAKAFGITRQSAAYICGCDTFSNEVNRYTQVAELFKGMGDEAFVRRYYTSDIADRIDRIKHQRMRAADDRSNKGPNRDSRSHAYSRIGTCFLSNSYWRIDWTPGDGFPNGEGGPGWRFSHCNEDGSLPDGYFYQGAETITSNPYGEVPKRAFRTSVLAYKAMLALFT